MGMTVTTIAFAILGLTTIAQADPLSTYDEGMGAILTLKECPGNAPPGFQSMIDGKRITPVYPPGGSGINHFFKRNPS